MGTYLPNLQVRIVGIWSPGTLGMLTATCQSLPKRITCTALLPTVETDWEVGMPISMKTLDLFAALGTNFTSNENTRVAHLL